MMLEEVKFLLYGKVIVYRNSDNVRDSTFENVYIGKGEDMPPDVLSMEIQLIEAKKKGVLSIWVYKFTNHE